jgi:hypothetical protein
LRRNVEWGKLSPTSLEIEIEVRQLYQRLSIPLVIEQVKKRICLN